MSPAIRRVPIRVLNAEGDTTASALREAAPSSGQATEQEYFRVHREHPDTGLFVSRPVRSPWTGTYGIVLSRRLTRANGSFAGVVSGSIRLSFFQDLFADLTLGERSTIGLFRTDGTLLLRTPFNEADVGRDLRTAGLFQHFPQARAGVYESVAQMDGERRLYVYTQVADLPLVLSVATSARSIYADWWHQAIEFSVVMLLLDITVSGLLIDLMRELRQRADRLPYHADLTHPPGLPYIVQPARFRRGVAQPGSAPALGAGGPQFKSGRPDTDGAFLRGREPDAHEATAACSSVG